MTHCIDVCLCGAVQYDCGCPGLKPERVMVRACTKCVLQSRDLIGDVDWAPSTVVPTEQCMSEEDAESNREVRLAVYRVVAGLTEPKNPQLLLAEVNELVEVPDRWKQLARDLISEANGELRLRKREAEYLVQTVDPTEWQNVANEVLSEHALPSDPSDRVVANLVGICMKRTQGKADPSALRDYIRAWLAG